MRSGRAQLGTGVVSELADVDRIDPDAGVVRLADDRFWATTSASDFIEKSAGAQLLFI
jgi:hypothetical protein